tara:strand:+ start:841 stop:2607 length:1767 start_codon:yes stop_codon:yes gene_type:complete
VNPTKKDLKKLANEGVILWDIYPHLYITDTKGALVYKKDGTPKRRAGKLKGSPHNKHSTTIHKEAVKSARVAIKTQADTAKRLVAKAAEAKEKVKKNKNALKKLDGNNQGTGRILSSQDLDALPQAVKDQLAKEEATIAFQANEGPQYEFLASSELQVLYGGAAGGGKSYAMLADPLAQMHLKQAKALLIRRTMPELRELIDKSHELYPIAFPGAKYNKQDKIWAFPSGAKLEFGYCERDSDVMRYQGQAYTWIGFDELTQWSTAYCWNYLFSRLRDASGTGIQVAMRATANPGGVGGHWVKDMFINPSPPNETFGVPVIMNNGETKYVTRKFIPALLRDNPYLNNGQYEMTLASLPPVLRKQLLEGNWDVVEGAAFPEFDPKAHVIAPMQIPPHWELIKGVDYGFAAESAVIWAAVDPEDGTLIIYRELYKKGLVGSELGAMIREMERPDIRSVPGVLDGAAWSNAGGGYHGPTVGEVLVKQGHKLRRADKNRKAGKIQVHERLAYNHEVSRPKMQIFSSCPNLIRELQSLPTAKNDPEDVDTHAQDHAYDALRYLIMARPRMEGHMQRMARYKSEVYQPADSKFGY